MPKQINVKLGFEADTSQAKKQIQDLQKSLDGLMTSSMKNTSMQDFSKGMIEAQQSAVKLKSILGESMNIDTGRLDLVKFNQQLQDSGLTLSKLGSQLSSLGPEGKKAFLSLADSIVTAQKPMVETNKLLDGMWTALKNTARWQLSSSMLHGFMSSIQGAYGYAQDLNASLNSIRIVSGQSVEQMAAFADQANRSAQALNTSTLAYTDAALIFYQQGLSGDAVTERVDTVLKLSNVTGDSAEQVSNYMTAIWNNFYDGSESLESFADKITALGAATASSSAEISAGLQQFAAIGQTVGLSYDYAVTALATIVAKTRQSESTVGNGLRTIFARLSSLKQGDTTEDGVDLTKYTKALQDIGVNLFDQNGQYREMDGILDDIGEKWQTLSKNQQISLAQTVGGVRQYATIMALFDDWGQFQRNLNVTQNSEGALEEQAEIYAESWEAARKRVQTAWQAIYQDLIDDKFFISILNGIADVLKGVDKLIDSIGGLKGVLTTIGAIATQVFGKQLEIGLKNAQTNINKMFFGDAISNKLADEAVKAAKERLSDKKEDQGQNTIIENQIYQIEMNKKLRESRQELTQDEMDYYQALLKTTGELAKQSSLSTENVLKINEEFNKIRDNGLYTLYNSAGVENNSKREKDWEKILTGQDDNFNKLALQAETPEGIKALTQAYKEEAEAIGFTSEFMSKLIKLTRDKSLAEQQEAQDLEKLENFQNAVNVAKDMGISLDKGLLEGLTQESGALMVLAQQKQAELLDLDQSSKEYKELEAEIDNITERYNKLNDIISKIDTTKGVPEPPGESPGLNLNISGIVKGAQAVTQLTMAWTTLSSAYKVVKDDSIPIQEKFTRVLTALGMAIPAIVNGFTSLKIAMTEAIIPFIVSHAAIVAVVAALAALGAAAYYFSNQEEIAAKKSAKAAQEAREEWQKSKDAYDNLYNSLTSYQDGVKALEELKEGTVEWTKAVLDLNNQVLELLELYPELAQYVTSTNGVLQISQEGMQALIDTQYTETMQKQLDYANKNFNASSDQKELAYKEAGESISYRSSGNGGMAAGSEKQISKDIMRAAAEVWGENSSLFNSDKEGNLIDTEGLISALENHGAELGKDAEVIAQALSQQQAVVADVYGKNIGFANQAQAIYDSVYQQVISSELTDQEKNLSDEDKSLYNSFLQDRLADQVSRFEEEKGSEATIEEIAGLLNSLVNSFGSAEGLKDAVVGDRLSEMGNQLIENQGLNASDSSTQKIRDDLKEYYNGLSDEDKKLFLTLDIDKETSKEQLDEKLQETKAEIEEAQRNDIEGVRSSLDSDVDEEEWESLANYIHDNAEEINQFAEANERLSEDLLNSKKSSAELAEAILRFDDAIQNVTDNYEEWMDMLNSGSLQDKAKAANQLADAYGDLLDIDGSQLSASFLESTENLDLMKAAIEGNSEAYDQLQQKMGEDIIAHLEFAPDDLSNFYNELDIIKGMLDRRNFDDLEIGAELNDQAFLNELTNMVNAAHMTAEEATAYLASMGIDAEIEEQQVDEEEVNETPDFVPHITEMEHASGQAYRMNGTEPEAVPLDYQFYGVTYEPKPNDLITKKQAKGFTLKVKSAKKSSGGDFKYKHSNHGGGANGAGNTRGSGGKGGGGGGGSKKKTVKEHKKPEKKEDRYHDIKERIEDLNIELKRLQKTEDRVYGKAKLKYMDQEIEKLEKQIELTDEYIAEIKKYAAIDQANLRGIGMGAQFDENGRLTNYEEVLSNIVSSYNSSIAAYNSAADAFNASAQEDEDSAALEIAEKQVSAAKEVYDERLKILDQYEDTYNLYQQKMDERIDQVWELFNKRLEKITWRIEFELDWNEKELTQFDWLLKYIGKDADHAADAVANLSKQMGVYEESLEWAKQGIAGIFDLHGITFDFDNADPQQLYNQLADFMNAQNLESQLTEKEADALLDYMDAMRDAYDGMYDAWIDAHDHMMNAWDEWQERLQDGLNDIAQYGKELEGIQKIIDLTGRKMLKMTTQDINRMNQALVVNAQEYLRAATARRDALEPSVQAAEAHLQELIAGGASEEAIQLARDEYRKMMEDWQDATNDWYDAFADALQAGENAFNAFIENSTKDYKEGFGKMDLDYMTEQFDRQKKVRDLYLDDYQKYHELNKTAQELNKSLAATNNDLIREKLLDLQDDMNASMQDGVKISSAQAEIYARRVALLQAEAELLDAQNAKSAVRMTRDNEGNFSYTYTADQEQIGEAENNYGDKFYELLEFERNYADQIQEEMLQSFQDFIDRRNEIAELYKDDQDAYNQAMEELQEEYLAYMDYYVGELDMDFYEMGRLRDDDWLDFEDITGQKLAEHDDFIDHFTDTITGELTEDYNTAGELANQWRALMEKSCQDSTQAVSNYQINTETTYNKAGENIETYGQKVNQKFDEMANKSVNTADAVEDMANDMVNAMAAIQGETYELDNTWAYVMDDMRNQIANTISALQQLMQSLDLVVQKAQAAIAAAQAAAMAQQWAGLGNDVGGGSGPGGGSGNNPGGSRTPSGPTDINADTIYYIPNGAPSNLGITARGDVNYVENGGKHNTTEIYPGKGSSMGNGIPSNIPKRASGGYTGAWGPEGVVNILHEKEYVLNKDDTANIFKVVDIVRELDNKFGLSQGLGNFANSIISSGSLAMAGAGTMDQNVHIEANFPNVQSHSEIEMALNNLINSASQYVNKK